MRKTLLITCTLMLSCLFFSTAHAQKKTAAQARAQLIDLLGEDSLDKNSDFGRIVRTEHVKACTTLYLQEMAKHGFAMRVEPTSLQINQTKKITQSEHFRGLELIGFLDMAAARREHHNTRIKVVFGMYTDDYLAIYATHLTDAQRAERKNRIAVFLVTCDWNERTKKYEFAKEEDEDDEYAFDFGGLQP